MEFLDINLTKDSSPLLHAIHSPLYWRIVKKIIFFSGFKNPYKKIRETRKLESIHEKHFVEWKNEDRKPHKNSSLRRLYSLCLETQQKCRSRIPYLVRGGEKCIPKPPPPQKKKLSSSSLVCISWLRPLLLSDSLCIAGCLQTGPVGKMVAIGPMHVLVTLMGNDEFENLHGRR